MTFKKLISICKPIAVTGPKPVSIGSLRQDSRAVQKGDVFIAVRGTQTDGHSFIDTAIKKGAVVVICEEMPSHRDEVCFIQVKNTRALLGPLAQGFAGHPGQKLRVIGITGTNGKTTVATLTYQVLQELGARASLLGTVEKRINDEKLDSRLTTADPIELAGDMQRMADAGSRFLVMEVSSHALDQQRVAGIDFEVAAFTNLSHDHLDYHSTIQAYAKAKKRLFDDLKTQSTAVINIDNSWGEVMSEDCRARILFFGFDDTADLQIDMKKSDASGLIIEIDDLTIKSPLVGQFNAYNLAEAFLICRSLGFDDQSVARALQTATGAAGRLERVQLPDKQNQPLVLVDYAHTPAALENVLQSLRETKSRDQKLQVIFGCGGDRDKTKRAEMAGVAEKYADQVTITSDNPRTENPDAIIDDAMQGFRHPEAVRRITDRREAIEHVIAEADNQSVILIAGKGHETYQEVQGERHPFDDRTIARRALAARNGNPKAPEVC